MRRYKIIGLTGPSGAGKSAAAEVFRELGYEILDADGLSRMTLKRGSITLKMLQAAFGDDVADENGEPDRRLIAERAFADKQSTELLNQITHPSIYMFALAELKRLIDSGKTRIVFDAPTLLDSNGQFICDAVVSVIAEPEIRLQRIIARDKLTREQAEKRISAQHPDSFYIEQSDVVLYNNGDTQKLKDEIYRLFQEQ